MNGTIEDTKEWVKASAIITAKAWADESFKEQFVANPIPILKQHGVAVPADTTVVVKEDTPERRYWLLPYRPERLEMWKQAYEHVPQLLKELAPAQQVMFKAWTDEAFRQRFLSDPRAIFHQYDDDVAAHGVPLEVLESSPSTCYFILKAKPAATDAVIETLVDELVYAAASNSNCTCTCGSHA